MTQPSTPPTPNRKKRIGFVAYACFAISLVFVVLGIGMIRDGAEAGIPVTLFFGMCAAIFVLQMCPGLLQRDTRTAASLLARYPGPVVLRTTTIKLLVCSLLSAIFGGVILWMLLNDTLALIKQLILWPGAAFFLFGSVMLLVRAASGGTTLHLNRDGFEMKSIWNTKKVHWQDSSEFTVTSINHKLTKLVAFDDTAVASTGMARLNRHIIGHHAGLTETYGLTHEDLAELLNAWRARALAQDAIFTRWPENKMPRDHEPF
ncbi:hypothetical protein [Bordetella muralis]|jgi:hypothetical protein|uniref:hypothetical protein n=1 Tax=Bordetella muralis TaxID=1649130 RepID=UPI0039F14D2A